MTFECSRCKSTHYFFHETSGKKTCKSCNLEAPARYYSDILADTENIGTATNTQLVTKQNNQLAKSRRKYIIGAIFLMALYLIGTSTGNNGGDSKNCKDKILGEYASGKLNDSQYQDAFNACGP